MKINSRSFSLRRAIPATLFAGAVLFCRPLPAQTAPPADAPAAPARVATIKLKLVLENMQETIDAQQQIADLQKQLDAMTRTNQADLKILQDKAVDPATRGTAARDAAVDELDRKSFSLRQEELAAKLKIQRLSSRQLVNGFREINAAVKDLATQRGYDVVVIDNSEVLPPNSEDLANQQTVSNLIFDRRVLRASDQVDISIDVITELNKGYKAPAGITPRPALPTTAMQIGSKTYQLEIAGDQASREHGLMERNTLPADHGMIFVFSAASEQNFWMHHTRFPLDIIYVGANGRVVSIKTMKPYDETAVPSDGEAKYAIELNAGQAATTGLKPGDPVKIPAAADSAAKN
jgi:uncharacterized membrane protein (UPF0127 family)/Skp family chaperone for outer membrane proteins